MANEQTPQEALERILAAKKIQRHKLAQLPFEEKILIVLQLQKLSRELNKPSQPAEALPTS